MRVLLALLVWIFATVAADAQSTVSTPQTAVVRDGSDDTRPVPDPTVLTTQQLDRALLALENVLNAKREGLAEVFEERFKGIDVQFSQRDVALTAALAAQKEAVGKTETNFADLIRNLDGRISDAAKNTDGQINDIKLRLASIEGQSKGSDTTWAFIVAAGGLIGGLIIGAIGLRRAPSAHS